MAANAAAFIKALGLAQVDVLGFSLGGLVAQALAVAKPNLVRRLILVGTGPRGGRGMASLTPEAQAVFALHMRIRMSCGSAFSSHRPWKAKRPAAHFCGDSASGPKIATRK
jgi:pimeloyl-ACP methyl ester carboxylesterase